MSIATTTTGTMTNLKKGKKDSDIPWIGSIPTHWRIKPLMAVANEQQVINSNGEEKNVLSLSYGNIIRRDVESNFGLLPESFNGYQIVKSGDTILRLTDLQNDHRSLRTGLAKEKGIITSAYLCLRFHGELSSEYAHYCLHAYDLLKVFYSMGGGVRQSIGFWEVKRLPIIIPPRPEQDAIVAFLDTKLSKINQYITNKKREIELLNEYKASLIAHVVTKGVNPKVEMKESALTGLYHPSHWRCEKLRYFATLRFSNVDKIIEEGELPIKLCNYTDVYNNDCITNDLEFMIGSATPQEIEKFTLHAGDVIITKDSESWNDIAVPAFVPSDLDGVVCGYHLAVIHPQLENLQGKYLFYALQAHGIRDKIYLCANGVTRYGLSQNAIKNTLLPIPPIDEQIAISKYLDEKCNGVAALIQAAKQNINKMSEFRQSLITDAVTGKIDISSVS